MFVFIDATYTDDLVEATGNQEPVGRFSDEYFSQKETRSAMWQQSRSIMFRPADEIIVTEKEPIPADI